MCIALLICFNTYVDEVFLRKDTVLCVHLHKVTFEDKFKENLERGNAELEKRRLALQEQQRREEERRAQKAREEQERKDREARELELRRKREEEQRLERQREMERQREEERLKELERKEVTFCQGL